MAAYASTDQVSGQGTTANLPNFVGEYFALSPLDTPLLTMLGGLSGGMGKNLDTTQFTWQDSIHRAPADQAINEGADATFSSQRRNERKNVVQIFQYGVELSYSKQAATGLIGTSLAGAPTNLADVDAAAWIGGEQPVNTEMDWQLRVKIEQAGLDGEWAILNNTFANPNTTAAARQTQGIIGAISTIAKDATSAAAWSVSAGTAVSGRIMANETAVDLYDNGARLDDRMTVMLGASEKLALSNSFSSQGAIEPRSRREFGVNITSIETDVGPFDVVLNRHLTAGTVLFLNLNVMDVCFLPTPGKGSFFLEPLSKAGSYDRQQLYGEMGLEYGPEGWHAKVTNFDGTTVTS
jgi:hypothetical protein